MKTTALVEAAKCGHDKCVELLIGRGANVNHQNVYGRTPLMGAAKGGHAQVCRTVDTGRSLCEPK